MLDGWKCKVLLGFWFCMASNSI